MIIVALCLTIVYLALLVSHIAARQEWTRERAALLQRIQSPEQAVRAHAQPEREKRPRPRSIVADDRAQARAARARQNGDTS